MENNRYLGDIISIDCKGTLVKDDAFSINIDDDNNYILNVYIADGITGNTSANYYVKEWSNINDDRLSHFSIKGVSRKYSLSEASEQNAFCFSFKINSCGDVIDFSYQKNKIQIDIELDYEDVFDVIDEESELCDYICLTNQLAEILYTKRTNGKEFDGYSEDTEEYNLPFPREFSVLLNSYITKLMYNADVPLIYNVKEINNPGGFEMWYYTSIPTKTIITKDYYGSFTSPIRKKEDFINLKIFNDIFVEDFSETQKKELIDKYRELLDGYVRMKEESLTTGYRRRKR